MEDEYYKVYEVPFPGDILGAVRIDENGFASIYINRDLSPKAKRETVDHELDHLRRNDLYNDLSIYEVEAS